MNYLPHTAADKQAMLSAIGVKNIDALFSHIPADLKVQKFDLPAGKTELEIIKYFQKLSQNNEAVKLNLLGGGFYNHHIPVAIDFLVNQSAFYTAYTPYQPEASQGSLQALFEYQSAICRLTNLEVSNASLYDGGTALAEAVLMAIRIKQKNEIIIDKGVNPLYRSIIKTYLKNLDVKIIELEHRNYQFDVEGLKAKCNENTIAVVLQNPNFFGSVQDFTSAVSFIHEKQALAILSFYPISLGILKSPGEMGFDIATAEGQSLGMPLSFGGPYLGIIATKREFIRQMPGRIVGETVDKSGKRGYVLTLQAREQHIRREKATSNICSNQSLCALRALVYLSLVGPKGLKEVAELNLARAEEAKKLICKYAVIKNGFTFNEFVIEPKKEYANLWHDLLKKDIILGLPLDKFYPELKNQFLVSVTENVNQEELEQIFT